MVTSPGETRMRVAIAVICACPAAALLPCCTPGPPVSERVHGTTSNGPSSLPTSTSASCTLRARASHTRSSAGAVSTWRAWRSGFAKDWRLGNCRCHAQPHEQQSANSTEITSRIRWYRSSSPPPHLHFHQMSSHPTPLRPISYNQPPPFHPYDAHTTHHTTIREPARGRPARW